MTAHALCQSGATFFTMSGTELIVLCWSQERSSKSRVFGMGQLFARLGSPRKITRKTGGNLAEFSIFARSSAALFRHSPTADRPAGCRGSHGHGGQISRAG